MFRLCVRCDEKPRHPPPLAFPNPGASHNVAVGVFSGLFYLAHNIHVGDSYFVIVHCYLRSCDGLLCHFVLVSYPEGQRRLRASLEFALVALNYPDGAGGLPIGHLEDVDKS